MQEATRSPPPRLRRQQDAVASLGSPERVWAIGSLYGRYGALCQMHEALAKNIRPNDRIVYLGNYLGATSQWSGEGAAVISELISFRTALAAIDGFGEDAVTFLRGRMEDLCIGLSRLPFHKDPSGWAEEALQKGLGAYLAAYSVNPQALIDAAGAGPFVSNRFTYYWQKIIAGHAGHEDFFKNLWGSARTESARPLAFIPEGLDSRLPLGNQRETLCWPENDIASLPRYFNYARILRGSGSPAINENAFVLSLDGGNALSGAIHALGLDARGQVIESLTF